MKSGMRLMGFLFLIGFTFYLPKIVSQGGLRPHPGLLGNGSTDGSAPLATEQVANPSSTWTGADASFPNSASNAGASSPISLPTPQVARQMLPYEQFLRFDVTPQWITRQFPRVTVLPTPGGQGMRVALITGTRGNDLTGALTYYFDRKELVQRISIQGATGDPAELVAFLKQHYKLEEVARDVYARQFNQIILSGLIVERSRLIEDGKPAGGYQVTLELNRPENYSKVSHEFHARLFQAAGA